MLILPVWIVVRFRILVFKLNEGVGFGDLVSCVHGLGVGLLVFDFLFLRSYLECILVGIHGVGVGRLDMA